MLIMSIEEIVALLRQQADLRSLENDEAGVLQGLAERLEKECRELEHPMCDQRPDMDDLPHTFWKCSECGAENSCLDGECQYCDYIEEGDG